VSNLLVINSHSKLLRLRHYEDYNCIGLHAIIPGLGGAINLDHLSETQSAKWNKLF